MKPGQKGKWVERVKRDCSFPTSAGKLTRREEFNKEGKREEGSMTEMGQER